VVRANASSLCLSQTSANRIVIFDPHFNPTITVQAIHRLFRFGQTKPVFCYNLLTQGTTEEKIYGRCVNKTGISLRVVDKLSIERCFTAQELEDLLDNLIWVQCEKCEKWRVLVNVVSDENIPESWDCSMNTTDPYNNKCEASEKSQAWYEQKFYNVDSGNENGPNESPKKLSQNSKESQDNPISSPNAKGESKEVRDQRVANDEILVHLLNVTEEGKKKRLICEHYFHESLMETTQSSVELDKVQRLLNPQND
jgi:CW-type Zinc Finger